MAGKLMGEEALSELWSIINEWGLKDTTKTMFNLGADAVPDNVFAFLGKYNQHYWKTVTHTTATRYREKLTTLSTSVQLGGAYISYSSTISIDQETGAISLVNPTRVYQENYNSIPVAMRGMYIKGAYGEPNTVFKLIAGSACESWDDNTAGYWLSSRNSRVTAEAYQADITEEGMVSSGDRNAYPDSGSVGNVDYIYQGVPFENLLTAPKIECGSYTGTGTYGYNDHSSLTFDFVPKIVAIYAYENTNYGADANFYWRNTSGQDNTTWIVNVDTLLTTGFIAIGFGTNYSSSNSKTTMGKKSEDGKTIEWYVQNANAGGDQLNDAKCVYHYIAIG